jgi:hypothetical protein
MKREPCAVGLSIHTGWAACVIAAGSAKSPRILAREIVEVLGDAERFVYHMAAELPLPRAERSVEKARQSAQQHARTAVKRMLELATEAEHRLVACAIVAKKSPMPDSLADIVAAHPRIHTAEGAFYRDVFQNAAKSNKLKSVVISPNHPELAAQADIASLVKKVGRPWSRDERLAALAAWSVLKAG